MPFLLPEGHYDAEWCSGSTTGLEPVSLGSSPGSANLRRGEIDDRDIRARKGLTIS